MALLRFYYRAARNRVSRLRSIYRSIVLVSLAQKLPSRQLLELTASSRRLCNPTITHYEDRLIVFAREHTYRLTTEGVVVDAGQQFGSSTVSFELDSSFCVTEVKDVDVSGILHDQPALARGLEDPRLFQSHGQLFCLWTAFGLGDQDPPSPSGYSWSPEWSRTTSTMFLARINNAVATDGFALNSPTGRTREKNWMPIDRGEVFRAIYQVDEGAVVELRKELDKNASTRLTKSPPGKRLERSLRGWSGSSPLIEWERGYICVVHKAARNIPVFSAKRGPAYVHSFLRFDQNLRTVRKSRNFYFMRRGVEFCGGLTRDLDGVVLFFGRADEQAFLTKVSVVDINAMFH